MINVSLLHHKQPWVHGRCHALHVISKILANYSSVYFSGQINHHGRCLFSIFNLNRDNARFRRLYIQSYLDLISGISCTVRLTCHIMTYTQTVFILSIAFNGVECVGVNLVSFRVYFSKTLSQTNEKMLF